MLETSMALRTWSVRLSGDPDLILLLPSRFQTPELQVIQEPDGTFYLYSAAFDPNAGDVYGPAMEQFSILRGAVAALFGRGGQLGWDSIRKVAADGQATQMKYGTVEMGGRSSMAGTLEGGSPAQPDGDPMVRAALKHPDLRRAFEIFGGWDATPVNLYKVYEIIKDNVGGQRDLENRPWSGGKKQMDRFRRSMCHQDISGDLARHERDNSVSPADPMSIDQASGCIAGLLRGWIEELNRQPA